MCPNGCGRRYKNKNYVTYHLKFECGVCPKFKCVVCNKMFTRHFSLKMHMLCVHKMLIK